LGVNQEKSIHYLHYITYLHYHTLYKSVYFFLDLPPMNGSEM